MPIVALRALLKEECRQLKNYDYWYFSNLFGYVNIQVQRWRHGNFICDRNNCNMLQDLHMVNTNTYQFFTKKERVSCYVICSF